MQGYAFDNSDEKDESLSNSVVIENDREKEEVAEKERLGDWNQRFQEINEQIKSFDANTPLNEQAAAFTKFSALARDFNFTAQVYGKIIISEVYLPDKEKTIKPINVGGVIGGLKYLIHKIFFKVNISSKSLNIYF